VTTEEPTTRPRLHFTADEGWINDPVALMWNGGRHHLFYQYVEGSALWQPAIGWGHASSADLMSWTEHPPALSPGDGDLGCWSGSVATNGEGRTVLFYTSVNDQDYDRGEVRVAEPADASWETWIKGPVVASVPEGLGVTAFRDPSVFEDRGVWRMFVGAGYADGRAGVLGFSSHDLDSWTFDGPVAERKTNKVDTGAADRVIWECPHLVRLDHHDLLVSSVWADGETCYVEVGVGHYRDGRFAASDWSRLTFGGPYAAMRFADEAGRTGLVFWLREVRDHAAGWAGALSVPYLVSVEDGAVRLVPHDALMATDGWRSVPRDGEPTRVPLPGGATLEVTGEAGGFRMSAWGRHLLVPAGVSDATAQLLVDGPIVELCTGTALASLPMRL